MLAKMESAMSYEDLSSDLRSSDVISEGQHRPVAGEELPIEEQQNLIEPQELPFYLMRAPPPEETVNGSTNLILHNERQNSFKKYCCKKVAEPLSAFLHDFPGNVDTTSFFTSGEEAKETSTLNSLLDPKLQVNVKKEIYPLTNEQLQSFTLYPGSVLPEKYMLMVQSTLSNSEPISTSSKKPKKSKRSSNETEQANGSSAAGALGSEKSEKKKKKKEKKKKKDKDKEKDKDKDKEKEKKSASND